jgi:hypothetical protein
MIRKVVFICGFYFCSWLFVLLARRGPFPYTDYLDRLAARCKPKGRLEAQAIMSMADSLAYYYWFHKQRSCLAKSLALYYYLKRYGYSPLMIFEVDLTVDRKYNCHARVVLPETDDSWCPPHGDRDYIRVNPSTAMVFKRTSEA